jgi:two-component sensor histidine kinase
VLVKKTQANQLQKYRSLYENDKIKTELQKKELLAQSITRDFNRVNTERRTIVLYLSATVVLLFICLALIVRLLHRRRQIGKINKNLADLNKRHETLLVESNHRIKNNLQMIISMLELSAKQDKKDNS